MCGRYNFTPLSNEVVRALYEQLQLEFPDEPIKTGEIFPTDTAPVVTAKGPTLMTWGFPRWSGPGEIINARQETITEKPTFKKAYAESRCLIPTTGFYEWTHPEDGSPKDKYLFFNEAPILWLAGISKIIDGEMYFVIITTGANESVASVHDRMPVIVDDDHKTLWLTDGKAASLILASNQAKLQRLPVSA
ncbi:MAG: SOS response-associated peptidase [Actinobacteria bacterium]|nr:SOS response-associated peptidase [Actinomycetota bacterium]